MQSDIYRNSPLSELHMRAWERKFHNFMSPTELKTQYDQLFRIMGNLEFFIKAGLTFMRDAYISAKFGTIRDVEKVRLIPMPNRENGCEVIDNGDRSSYRVVKLVEVDPKLREAYKAGKLPFFKPITEEALTTNLRTGIQLTERVLIEKSQTISDDQANILIYFNLYELDGEEDFTTLVTDRLKSIKHGFTTVNFIRQGKVYRFGPDYSRYTVIHNKNDIF